MVNPVYNDAVIRRVSRTSAIGLALWFALATAGFAGAPDLVLVISIDQFPYEYIQRFSPYFSAGGFNRFLNAGANFSNAWYEHSATTTGPGHASIGTGLTPSRSGIISNTWFDRALSAPEYCVHDGRVSATAGTAGGMSPVNLSEDSLGDRLIEKSPGSKVIGLAIKDRAAILMAGRKASAAYWFEPTANSFISSTYYRFNPAVLGFNSRLGGYLERNRTWTMSNLIAQADLARLTYDPPQLRQHKEDRLGLGVSFPHPVKDLIALTYTPFGNDVLLDLAKHVIEVDNLGTDDGAPDLLYIGLSSPDYLGHFFGPDSLEVADTVIRTDRSLGQFLEWVSERVGPELTVALTADHGVQPIPEVARARGREAGRVNLRQPPKDAKTFAGLSPDRLALEKRIAQKLKQLPVSPATPLENAFLLFADEVSVYINWPRVQRSKLDRITVRNAVRDALRETKGVAAVFSNTQLMLPNSEAPAIEAAVRKTFRADRSGDVIVVLKPGYVWDYSGKGTNHGLPVESDQHVPLMLWGVGVKPGQYPMRVAPTDLARSLGTLLGVSAGGSDTIVLHCIEPPSAERRVAGL